MGLGSSLKWKLEKGYAMMLVNGSKLKRGGKNRDNLNVECSVDFLDDRDVVIVMKMGVWMQNGGMRSRVVDAEMTVVWKELVGCWRHHPN